MAAGGRRRRRTRRPSLGVRWFHPRRLSFRGFHSFINRWPLDMGIAQSIGPSEPFDGTFRGGRQRLLCCFLYDHSDEQFGSFLFRVGKILRALQTEQLGKTRIIPLRQQLQAPAQRGGSETKRGKRVSNIMLAIAESPLPIFPSLAPSDGGQPHMKSIRSGWGVLR